MKVLKGILSESAGYYNYAQAEIAKKLSRLSRGSVKKRKIAGKIYYYLQQRIGNKVQHKYLGKDKPENLLKQLKERKALQGELKKVTEALRMLKRAAGRKRG